MRRSSHSGSFLGLLFVVFLVLKLTGVIDWSWWWVTSPLWLPVALVLGGLLIATVLGLTIYKVVVAALRRRGRESGSEGPLSGASAGGEAEAVVVEAVGSEVVDPQARTTDRPSLLSAGSPRETAESQPGSER